VVGGFFVGVFFFFFVVVERLIAGVELSPLSNFSGVRQNHSGIRSIPRVPSMESPFLPFFF